MKYNVNQIKTNVVAGYKYCKKVYNGGIESPEQFDAFVNLCQNYLDSCNHYCGIVRPTFGILQYKRYKDFKSVRNICADAVNEINNILTGLQAQFDKQQEEAEAYAQLESRMRFEAAVAYDIKEQEKQHIREESQKRQVGFIINKNEDNTDE
jgi:hypothetical protein